MARLMMALALFASGAPFLLAQGNESGGVPRTQPALIEMNLPANAEVWFDGAKTTQSGTFRRFLTPALTTNQAHTYQVRVRWMQGDQLVDKTRPVVLHGGDRVTVRADTAGAPVVTVARLPENFNEQTSVTPLSSTTAPSAGTTTFESFSPPPRSFMPESNRWAPDPTDPFTQKDAQGS